MYANEIQNLVRENGSSVIDSLANEAIQKISKDYPSFEIEVWEDGVTIKNYADAVSKASDGSILCQGKESAECLIESDILRYIVDNLD